MHMILRNAIATWLTLHAMLAMGQGEYPKEATLKFKAALMGSPIAGSGPVTYELPEGTVVTILERVEGGPFLKVEFNTTVGFIAEGYLDTRDPEIVRREREAKEAQAEADAAATESALRQKAIAREREELARLEDMLSMDSFAAEQLRNLCFGYRSRADEPLPVSCGLWKVGKSVDPMTDNEESYLSWIGGERRTLFLAQPGPTVSFSTEDILTITDRQVNVQLRIDKGEVRAYKAHTFQSQVTILASAAVKQRLIDALLQADQVVVQVPDYRNATHTVLLRFKPKNVDEKVQLESRLRRRAAIQLWKTGMEPYEAVLR